MRTASASELALRGRNCRGASMNEVPSQRNHHALNRLSRSNPLKYCRVTTHLPTILTTMFKNIAVSSWCLSIACMMVAYA